MMFRPFKKSLKHLLGLSNAELEKSLEKQLLLLAQAQSNENKQLIQIDDLSEVEFSVFSQWGEDGIIDWLIHQIPNLPKSFVEFGVENYKEANTRLLLQLRNWEGLVIDGSKSNIQDIEEQDIYWKHNLVAKHAFIDRDNINKLIEEAGFSGHIGLLSIDIDGNDYWVWEAVDKISPAIVIVEYNSILGDSHMLTIPYNSKFERTKAHYSNLYYGASLPAFINLGQRKGYTFIGTTSSGVNAFFVKNNLYISLKNKFERFSSYPSKHRESRNKKGLLDFASGVERFEIIKQLPLLDLKTNNILSLEDLSEIYSKEWTSHLAVSKSDMRST